MQAAEDSLALKYEQQTWKCQCANQKKNNKPNPGKSPFHVVLLGYHKVPLISDFFNFHQLPPSAENLMLRGVKEHKD